MMELLQGVLSMAALPCDQYEPGIEPTTLPDL